MQGRGKWQQWTDPQRPLRLLIRRLETQNSILCDRDVWHYLENKGKNQPVAWSGDEADIHFNASRLPNAETREDIIFITGVNNHEVAHVLYSPTVQDMRDLWPGSGSTNEMTELFLENTLYQWCWNVLEDQRIEMLMCRRYANMRPYYLATFRRVILQDGKHRLDAAYLLARGRRYLPVKIRRMLKRKFKAQAAIPDFRRIIDEFLTLNTFRTKGLVRSHELVKEFMQLAQDNSLLPPEDEVKKHESCSHHDQMVQSDQQHIHYWQPDAEGKADKTDVDRIDKEVADVADQVTAGNKGQADDGDGQKGSGKPSDSDAEDQDDPSDGTTQGGGAGAGNAPSEPTYGDVADELNKAVTVALETSNVGDDVQQAMTYIKLAQDIDSPRVREKTRVESELPPLARRVANALRVLESEVDPYWDRYQNHGKLNIQRVMMKPDDRDHAFDRWQEGGLGGVDQEWVVLLDCSGSMSANMGTLSQTAWIMKRAADLVEAKMTIIAYGSSNAHQVAFHPSDRADVTERSVLPDLGGTEPSKALLEAYRVLSHSKRAQKGLFVMTDGQWDWGSGTGVIGLSSPHEIIDALNGLGVKTHLAHLSSYGGRIDAHRCQTAAAINSVDELPQMMKDLIAGRMTKVR